MSTLWSVIKFLFKNWSVVWPLIKMIYDQYIKDADTEQKASNHFEFQTASRQCLKENCISPMVRMAGKVSKERISRY